jgi:single-strand DNA-binding protein
MCARPWISPLNPKTTALYHNQTTSLYQNQEEKIMLNTVTFMGRLTNDPELRKTKNDIPVTSFRIAVKRDFSNDEKDETDFFDVVAWRKTAEFVCDYFCKGRMICVIGRLQNSRWEDKHGQSRVTAELVAERAYFASDKAKEQDDFSPFDGNDSPFDGDDSPFAA